MPVKDLTCNSSIRNFLLLVL